MVAPPSVRPGGEMVLMGYRKEVPLGGVLALRFTWGEALDTAASVYHGVRAAGMALSMRVADGSI